MTLTAAAGQRRSNSFSTRADAARVRDNPRHECWMRRYTLMFMDATSVDEDDPDPSDDGFVEIVASRFMMRPDSIDIEKFDGGWIDFIVGFTFDAEDEQQLRSEAARIVETCGRDVDVFSVYDDARNVVLTENDIKDLVLD
jgi:hypothetical protein